jgi:hypothetical protein
METLWLGWRRDPALRDSDNHVKRIRLKLGAHDKNSILAIAT